MRKHNAPPMGCLDFGAFFLLFWTVLLAIGNPNGALFLGIWAIVIVGFIESRHGFIQTFLNKQKAQEQQQQMAQQRREAERAATQAAASVLSQDDNQASGQDEISDTVTLNDKNDYYPIYSISLPKDDDWKPASAVGLIRGLFERSGKGYIEFSIVATHDLMEWQVMFAPSSSQYDLTFEEVTDAVQRHYQNATVQLARIPLYGQPAFRKYRLYAVSQQRYFDEALNVNQLREKTDPLEVVANTMLNLKEGERLTYKVTVVGVFVPDQAEIERMLTVNQSEVMTYQAQSSNSRDLAGAITGVLVSQGMASFNNFLERNKKVQRYTDKETEKYLRKLTNPIAQCYISLTFDTPDKARLSVLDDASGAILQLSGDEISVSEQNSFVASDLAINSFHDAVTRQPYQYLEKLLPQKDGDVDQTGQYTFNFNMEELAAYWHLPHKGFEQTIIDRPQDVPEELIAVDEPSLVVGNVSVAGASSPIRIRLTDLNYHMFISGFTGTGKSTLIHNMAHQLVALDTGFTLLDPHGKLIDGLLSTSILEAIKDRIIVLRLSEVDEPVPLNIFKRVSGTTRAEAVSHVLNTIKRLYNKQWSATQMERVFRSFLELVLTDENATPLDMMEIAKVSNVGYRNRLLQQALAETDRRKRMSRTARGFWAEIVKDSESAITKKVTPVLNRLNLFLGKSDIEVMTCHPGAIDWVQVIEDDMIVLVDLSGQNIASEVESLGAIIFAQVYNAIQTLGYQEDDQPPRHFMMVDEAHRFMTNLAELAFSEARKFGMPLVMVDQWIGQLDKKTQEAVRNNANSRLSYRLDEVQAKKTAELIGSAIETDELATFDVGEAVLSTKAKTKNLPAFKLSTPNTPTAYESILSKEAILEQSRKNLIGVTRYNDQRFEGRLLTAEEVEDWLDERYEQPIFDEELQDDEELVGEFELKSSRSKTIDEGDEE